MPGFEHVQKLSVSVLEGGRSTSVVDVFNFGSTMLVPHITVGDLKIASLLMTGFTLLLDYINVPSVAEVSDFMVKKKKFLLSKLKLVGRKIDVGRCEGRGCSLPEAVHGRVHRPVHPGKMLTKGPPESYVPFEKYKVLRLHEFGRILGRSLREYQLNALRRLSIAVDVQISVVHAVVAAVAQRRQIESWFLLRLRA